MRLAMRVYANVIVIEITSHLCLKPLKQVSKWYSYWRRDPDPPPQERRQLVWRASQSALHQPASFTARGELPSLVRGRCPRHQRQHLRPYRSGRRATAGPMCGCAVPLQRPVGPHGRAQEPLRRSGADQADKTLHRRRRSHGKCATTRAGDRFWRTGCRLR